MTSSFVPTPIPAGARDSEPAIIGVALEPTVRLSTGCQPVPTPRPHPTITGSHGGFPQVSGYEILGVIGVGGMGIVYKARHRELNRIVALKMLGREWETDLDSRERFRAEAEAVAKLQHPNIIQLFDIGVCERGPGLAQPYMSLEYVEGSSLSWHTGTPQEPLFAAVMVEKVARAAGAAHRLGVIHRDLKPANVLLTAAGEPKVADFGLAKHLEPATDGSGRYHTQAGVVVGTPEYMAPEQVNGGPPTPAVDVHALGVMLYELLTGRVPFKGANLTDTLLMVRGEDPVPPHRLQPKVPRDLETICLKCLAKSPDKRYATAEELADDLARWADGTAIRARPAGRVERVGRWARRNPAVAGLLALSLLLAGAGVSAVVWKWRDAEASAADARHSAAVERWERYRANVRAAAGALELDNVAAARRSLAEAPVEYRGWEWHLLTAELDCSSASLRTPAARACTLLPTGTAVITAEDRSVSRWDLATGLRANRPPLPAGPDSWTISPDGRYAAVADGPVIRVRDFDSTDEWRLPGHTAAVTGVRFAPSGGLLASASADHTLRLWHLPSGRPLAVRELPSQPNIHDVSADGRRVVFTEMNWSGLAVWDRDRNRVVPLGAEEMFFGGRFSPDGDRYLASRSFPDCRLHLYDVETGRLLATLIGHTNATLGTTFSRDGRRLATCSMDRTACLWDAVTGKQLAVLGGHGGWVNAVTFSPDGERVATGSSDKTIRLWTRDGKLLAILRGHDGDVSRVEFSADGRRLYSWSEIDTTTRTWDLGTVERRGLLRGHDSFVYDVAYHPDGERVLSASWDGTAALWDTSLGKPTRQFPHPAGVDPNTGKAQLNYVNAVAVHPGGAVAATSCRLDAIRLWDLTRGELLHTWDVPTDDWRVSRLAFCPTGRLLACGGRDGNVYLFDWATRERVAVLGPRGEVTEVVQFSPDGRWLVTASDVTIRVWEVATRELTAEFRGHTAGINGLAFSPDGRALASASTDGTVCLWSVGTWARQVVLHHGMRVYTVAFHPKETRLVTGCADASIRVWDTVRWQEVAELRGHEEYVHAVAFSPDGRRLVSGSGDKTLRLWNIVPVRGGR